LQGLPALAEKEALRVSSMDVIEKKIDRVCTGEAFSCMSKTIVAIAAEALSSRTTVDEEGPSLQER
jgi:hypothetical protein